MLLLCLLAGVVAVLWQQSGSIDSDLVGMWEADPDNYFTFPMELRSDGSAALVDVWCGGVYTQRYRWTVDKEELRFTTPAPLQSLSLASVSAHLNSLFWSVVKPSAARAWRYRILGPSQGTLRLQLLDRTRVAKDGAVEVYQRAQSE